MNGCASYTLLIPALHHDLTHFEYPLRQLPMPVDREDLEQIWKDRGTHDGMVLAYWIQDVGGAFCFIPSHHLELDSIICQSEWHYFEIANADHDLANSISLLCGLMRSSSG